ncbi:MAG TPA: chemotaxis protein CheA [Syntrophorhabdaceae bacterium]
MSDQMIEKDEMQEIVEEFLTESTELMENVIQDMVAIEENPDEEVVNSIFRAVHTIKGTSSFLGFGALSNLAHKAEDVLGLIRKGEMAPDKDVTDVLLESFDLMKGMLDDIREKGAEDRDPAGAVENLEALTKPERKKIGEILIEEEVLKVDELIDTLDKQKTEPDKKLGEIVVEDKLTTEGQMKGFLTKQKSAKEDQTIRIDVRKLDELMNLVGELVLGKNRLILVDSLLKKEIGSTPLADNFADVTNYIEAITNELQLSVMKARLVPISKLFNKIPRLVRDLCKESKKEIELNIEGENTELDRSLIETLHDPLIHIIRNSVDHGVELPDERAKKGKKGKGVLSLKAYNEGNHIIIEIFDDGNGINLQAVKDKVKEKGLLNEAELNSMSPKDVMNLIFIPGLSTAKKVSSVSGRGVGMDVVKTNIEKMNGQVYVDCEEGQWTRLLIKLPLTLAIMRALIVQVAEELFAVPLNTVIELVKLKEGLVKSVDKNDVLVLRDKVIPVIDLQKIYANKSEDKTEGYIVICIIGEKTIGIKIHSVIGQEEVVIKPLGEFLGNITGVGGATIRGDGKVILILDMPAVVANFGTQRKAMTA